MSFTTYFIALGWGKIMCEPLPLEVDVDACVGLIDH